MRAISKAVLIMGIGGVVNQLIPLIAMPALTRIYSPESFGLFSSFFIVAAVLAIPATLRLDLAVVLPEEDGQAVCLACTGMIFATAFLAALSGTTLFVHAFVIPLSRIHPLGLYMALVPVLAWCIAAQNVMIGVANRRREYGAIAASGVVQQVMAAVLAVSLGIAGFLHGGLIVSRIAAFASGATVLVRFGANGLFRRVRLAWSDARGAVCRYRQFPLFNVPYSVSGLLTKDFPIVALTSFGDVAIAGQFAIARMAATLPGNLLTYSMSNVFYREAVDHIGTPQFTVLVWRVFRVLTLAVMPPLVLLILWRHDIFPLVFGHEWHTAGELFGYVALPFVLAVLTGWPERVFEVRVKQQWSFAIQIGFDMTTMIGIVTTLAVWRDPFLAIKIYALVQVVYQLVYLAALYVLIGLGMRRYVLQLLLIAAAAALMIGFDFVVSIYLPLTPIYRIVLLVAVGAATSLTGIACLVKAVRSVGSFPPIDGRTGANG